MKNSKKEKNINILQEMLPDIFDKSGNKIPCGKVRIDTLEGAHQYFEKRFEEIKKINFK